MAERDTAALVAVNEGRRAGVLARTDVWIERKTIREEMGLAG